jgi:hypothetical protein
MKGKPNQNCHAKKEAEVAADSSTLLSAHIGRSARILAVANRITPNLPEATSKVGAVGLPAT